MIRRKSQAVEPLIFNILIPSLLSVGLICNLLVDAESRSLRLLALALGLLASRLRLPYFLCVLLFCGAWWQVPVMIFGFPNQFVVEVFLLGWTIVTKTGSTNRNRLYANPFFIPIAFVTIVGLMQATKQIAGWIEVYPGEVSTRGVFFSLVDGLFDWNAIYSVAHGMSVIFGYMIWLSFTYKMLSHHEYKFLRLKPLCNSLIAGSFVIFVFGVLEHFYPDYRESQFSTQTGSVFQNGNHLSFYFGLVFLVIAASFQETKSRWPLLYLPLCLLAMTIGQGRTAMFALIIAISCMGLMRLPRSKYPIVISGVLVFVAFLIFTSPDLVLNTLRDLDAYGLGFAIFSSGRAEIIESAWELYTKSPIMGIGLGAFQAIHGLDIHSLYFSRLVEQGIFVFCVTIVFWLVSVIKSFRADRIALGFLLYIGLCEFTDVMTTYRTLLYQTTVMYFVFTNPIKFPAKLCRLPPGKVVLFVVGILVIAVFASRQPVIFLRIPAATTKIADPTSDHITWVSGGIGISFDKKSCLGVPIRVHPSAGSQTILAAVMKPKKGDITRDSWMSYFGSQENLKTIQVGNGPWNMYCFCASSLCLDCQLQLGSLKGGVISWSKRYKNLDHRYGSFAVGDWNYYGNGEQSGLQCLETFSFP